MGTSPETCPPADDSRFIWFGKMLTAVLGSYSLRVQPLPTNMSVQIYDRFHLKKKTPAVRATPPPRETLKSTDLSGNISTVSELLQN